MDTLLKVQRLKSEERTLAWAKAINRKNKDGSLWMPTKHSLICGNHFLSGRPSNNPNSPDFVPSLFTSEEQKKRQKPKTVQDQNRFIRAQRRNPTVKRKVLTYRTCANN